MMKSHTIEIQRTNSTGVMEQDQTSFMSNSEAADQINMQKQFLHPTKAHVLFDLVAWKEKHLQLISIYKCIEHKVYVSH